MTGYLCALGRLSAILAGSAILASSLPAAAVCAVPDGPLKIKGFYIGMPIEEAKSRLAELLDAKDALIEEDSSGDKTFFINNLGRIKKEDFKQINALTDLKVVEKVWRSLIEMGYINELGRIQKKAFVIANPALVEFSHEALNVPRSDDAFVAVQVSIYNMFKAANIPPKLCHNIVAGADKKVKYVYFSGGASDKLFNAEGADLKVFTENFAKAYVARWSPSVVSYGAEADKVAYSVPYVNGCRITLYSDKSLILEKVAEEKEFKMD